MLTPVEIPVHLQELWAATGLTLLHDSFAGDYCLTWPVEPTEVGTLVHLILPVTTPVAEVIALVVEQEPGLVAAAQRARAPGRAAEAAREHAEAVASVARSVRGAGAAFEAVAPRLVIKGNNASMRERCACCGVSGRHAQPGLALFVEGTYDAVCEDCARLYAPQLQGALDVLQRVPADAPWLEDLRARWGPHDAPWV